MGAAARILVAEDEQVCSLVVQRLMTKAGYEVTVVRDGQAALNELATNTYAAALVDWMLPVVDGIEVLRHIARMATEHRPVTILTSVIDIPSAREYALAAGAADFLAKPVAPARLLQLLKEMCATNDASEAPTEAAAKAHPLARSTTWQELGSRSTSPLGDLLGAPVVASSVSPATGSDGVLCIAATLVDPAHGCEIVASVLASAESTLEIGKQMLGGEATEAEAADALAEMVNVVAGVVKAAFVEEGFAFALGLPGQLTSPEFQRRQSSALASAAVNLTLGEHRFVLSYLVTQTTAIELPAEELHEGYVLAEDLRRNGALLLPICTRLTEGAARRIRETCQGTRVLVVRP